MPKYITTDKAGPYVAGYRNPGVGREIDLPTHAATYELLLGTLRPLSPAQAPKAEGPDHKASQKAEKKK